MISWLKGEIVHIWQISTKNGIVLNVEVLRFLRIISTINKSDEIIEEVDYKSPYSVVVLSSSGDIMKIMDKDVEHV